ncbi:hypothetical protein KAR91_03840 [Candidatus Pacearchaeota archaeon]|nr:hypothetical protein [Candidatus Pacearchaeota archaeon]
MAQLLLIKTANTALKTVGDIVGVYEDTHKFSEYELQAFTVVQVKGDREEVIQKLNAISVPVEGAFKAESTVWSRTRPEEKEVWKDVDDKWYFLEARLKYPFSMSNLLPEDKTLLETTDTGLARDVVFKKMIVNPGEWDTKNTVEATDLNA